MGGSNPNYKLVVAKNQWHARIYILVGLSMFALYVGSGIIQIFWTRHTPPTETSETGTFGKMPVIVLCMMDGSPASDSFQDIGVTPYPPEGWQFVNGTGLKDHSFNPSVTYGKCIQIDLTALNPTTSYFMNPKRSLGRVYQQVLVKLHCKPSSNSQPFLGVSSEMLSGDDAFLDIQFIRALQPCEAVRGAQWSLKMTKYQIPHVTSLWRDSQGETLYDADDMGIAKNTVKGCDNCYDLSFLLTSMTQTQIISKGVFSRIFKLLARLGGMFSLYSAMFYGLFIKQAKRETPEEELLIMRDHTPLVACVLACTAVVALKTGMGKQDGVELAEST